MICEVNTTIRKEYEQGQSGEFREKKRQSTDSHSLLTSTKQFFFEAFLPAGFPHTVSSDYVRYQFFDSCQALCSSVTGSLATAAVMRGVGVGDATANATSATVNWLIRDGANMIGRIVFSWQQSVQLDANSKHWRLVADALNDLAICLDMATLHLPSHLFLPLVCCSSVLRAVVGIAGGATKAAVSQHQSRANNIADVLAKDGSQETAVGLLGMLLALVIVPLVGGAVSLSWTIVLVGIVLHLEANYAAVRCIAFESLNRQRFVLLMQAQELADALPTPAELAREEQLLAPWIDRGVLRCLYGGSMQFGCSLQSIVEAGCGVERMNALRRRLLQDAFAMWMLDSRGRIVWFDGDNVDAQENDDGADDNDNEDASVGIVDGAVRRSPSPLTLHVCLREGISPVHTMHAFYVVRVFARCDVVFITHACAQARSVAMRSAQFTNLSRAPLRTASVDAAFARFVDAARARGYNLNSNLLAPSAWRTLCEQ
jgi:hypothetical protein